MKPQSLNDQAWEKLFDKHKILPAIKKHGFIEINSKQINVFRQSRLMTKFDHINNLPTLFTENSLSILPLTRRSYIIKKDIDYCRFVYKEIRERGRKIIIIDNDQSIGTSTEVVDRVSLNYTCS